MEAVGIAAIFNRPVLLEGVGFETGVFHRQRVIDDQLRGDYRIH